MARIEQAKAYTGQELETVFFRPMLTGPDAKELGIRIMYNMPVPTTINFWQPQGNILHKFTSGQWQGSLKHKNYQKTINLSRVKAEMGYGAENYFNKVFELITNRPDVNMGDLSGTELEEAETALFKQSISESIRLTTWLGDTQSRSADVELDTFDGIIPRIYRDIQAGEASMKKMTYDAADFDAEQVLKKTWDLSSNQLKNLKGEGNLAFFVTSDIYDAYEDSLDNAALESAFIAKQEGRDGLMYRGIPVIDLKLGGYLELIEALPPSFVLLTDRRNLVLAVNTADYPGTEVKMWYNPDMMENRQRAVFMAGCDYLLPELVSFSSCPLI